LEAIRECEERDDAEDYVGEIGLEGGSIGECVQEVVEDDYLTVSVYHFYGHLEEGFSERERS